LAVTERERLLEREQEVAALEALLDAAVLAFATFALATRIEPERWPPVRVKYLRRAERSRSEPPRR
jgi:hypothetical protein